MPCTDSHICHKTNCISQFVIKIMLCTDSHICNEIKMYFSTFHYTFQEQRIVNNK